MFGHRHLELFEEVLGQARVGPEFPKSLDNHALRREVRLALSEV